jgi:hypothetical protein
LTERARQRLQHHNDRQDPRVDNTQEVQMVGTFTIRMTAKPVEPPQVPGPN